MTLSTTTNPSESTPAPIASEAEKTHALETSELESSGLENSALEASELETSTPELNEPKSTILGPNPQDLAQRRRQLKAKRKFKFYKMAWRTVAMAALTVGTVRLATSPIWLIRSAQQIEVTNNQLLSDENIQALMPVPYPQSLLSVRPDELAIALTAYEPIETAVVRRRLIPPGLHVQIDERQPVAVTVPNVQKPIESIPTDPEPFAEPGLIDAMGNWMPRNSFTEIGAIAAPPALSVIGMQPNQADSWPEVFAALAKSPVAITAIDWSQDSNLVLTSELGTVHLGPYSKKFGTQLAALDQLRQLGDKVDPEQVAFIDLQDPQNPIVEILQAKSSP
ncbi:MAG: FtsQ-type POTRA domain-containing protein [Cyanobacteria bacterium J06576_12]